MFHYANTFLIKWEKWRSRVIKTFPVRENWRMHWKHSIDRATHFSLSFEPPTLFHVKKWKMWKRFENRKKNNREKHGIKMWIVSLDFELQLMVFFVLNECYIHPFLCWKKKSIPFNWRWIETGKLHHISWRAHQICATFWNELSWMVFFSFYPHIPIFAKIPILSSFGDEI